MKASSFSYVKPSTVDEAVAALESHLGLARVLAGGQSLVPMLGMRLMRPVALVDINGLDEELGRIEARDTETVVGALVRYSEIETSALVAERLPLLAHAARHVGDRQVRNRGTIGGALAQADPTGEMALASLALDATIVARGPGGEREIAAVDLFTGAYATALAPEDLLVAVRFPIAPGRFAFFEANRKHNDFAIVSIAVVADRGTGGGWERVRVALGGVADTAVLAAEVAERLEGRRWDDETVRAAVTHLDEALDPADDVRASAEYRGHLARVHLARLLRRMAREEPV